MPITTTKRLADIAEYARKRGLDVTIETNTNYGMEQVSAVIKQPADPMRAWLQIIATRFVPVSGTHPRWTHAVFATSTPTSKPQRVSMRYAHTWIYTHRTREVSE